ncbi:MAG: hypothetical protein IKV22_01250 [Paludibacteraceae bacterium]|nr:hypothetical protein [Paludibacteraceae bacterium]
MRKFVVLLVLLPLLVGCTLFEQQRKSGVVVEYNGQTLTEVELDRLTNGLSAGDSARVAEAYIRQWAEDLLEYDAAKSSSDKAIERRVEDYRRSLYVHEYEEHLIAQRMPKHVEDSLVRAFYATHSSRFVLDETIVKGMLLIVPVGAPNMDELKRQMAKPFDDENLEQIEKYAYNYATGYELFLEEWKNSRQILLRMPISDANLQKQLNQKRQLVVEDSINTYLLQVTDVHMKGAEMPLDYARGAIEQLLLNERRVEFLEQEREKLYEKAIQQGKLKRYEK